MALSLKRTPELEAADRESSGEAQSWMIKWFNEAPTFSNLAGWLTRIKDRKTEAAELAELWSERATLIDDYLYIFEGKYPIPDDAERATFSELTNILAAYCDGLDKPIDPAPLLMARNALDLFAPHGGETAASEIQTPLKTRFSDAVAAGVAVCQRIELRFRTKGIDQYIPKRRPTDLRDWLAFQMFEQAKRDEAVKSRSTREWRAWFLEKFPARFADGKLSTSTISQTAAFRKWKPIWEATRSKRKVDAADKRDKARRDARRDEV